MDVGSIKSSLNPIVTGRTPPSDERKQLAGGAEVGREEAVAPSEQIVVSREQVETAVSAIQEFVQSVRRSVNFSLEESSGRVVVKVTDASSGNVIRQIPSEEALQLAESLEEVRSLLFKAEA